MLFTEACLIIPPMQQEVVDGGERKLGAVCQGQASLRVVCVCVCVCMCVCVCVCVFARVRVRICEQTVHAG